MADRSLATRAGSMNRGGGYVSLAASVDVTSRLKTVISRIAQVSSGLVPLPIPRIVTVPFGEQASAFAAFRARWCALRCDTCCRRLHRECQNDDRKRLPAARAILAEQRPLAQPLGARIQLRRR